MSDKLAAFLAEAAGRGRVDMLGGECGLWLADWYMAATGKPDPAAECRGCYFLSPDLPYVVRDITRRLGLTRTPEPRRGDIGLVSLTKGHLVGGIFTGTHWCVLIDEHGIGAIIPEKLRFVAAWRVA